MLPGRSAGRFGIVDFLLLGLVTAFCGWIWYRVAVELNYSWNWTRLPQYLFRYDQDQGRYVANFLFLGLLTTIRLSLYAAVPAFVIGFIVALARTSHSLFCRLVACSYIELMRNLPPLVIIFLVYFFLADQLTPLLGLDSLISQAAPQTSRLLELLLAKPSSLSAFLSAVFTLSLFEGAYVAEILRSGSESVNVGQWEAAHALGLSGRQTLVYIVLPQGLRQVLPPLGGQYISLIKDSSIVSVISIQELTYQGTQLMASTYMTIEVWLLVAALYFLLTWPCSRLVAGLETSLTC